MYVPSAAERISAPQFCFFACDQTISICRRCGLLSQFVNVLDVKVLPPHAPFVPMCFVSDATDLCAPQVRLECQIVCVPDVEVLPRSPLGVQNWYDPPYRLSTSLPAGAADVPVRQRAGR